MSRIKTDICIMGGGSGGLSIAAGASQMGAKVVLLEGHLMGGDCLNFGCVPSKALIAAGKQAYAMGHTGDLGVKAVEPDVDYAAAKDHVRNVIDTIAPVDSQERFEGFGVHVIREFGRFISETEVQAGEHVIEARRFVIATGSGPFVPPIPGLDTVDVYTNENIFDLRERPDHLLVIGGGPIGMEMAQAHRRLGCKVTVIEGMKAMGKDDPEMAAIVLEKLRGEGIEIVENAGIYNVVLRRDEVRQLILSSPIPSPIEKTFDMRNPSAWVLIRDAMMRLLHADDQVVRVIGNPVQDGGLLIEITLPTEPLQLALVDYGIRILVLSAVISVITALLLFLAVRRFLVKPIEGFVEAMQAYAEAPEDARRIIMPDAGIVELHEAQEAMASMQTQLTGALRQKERLAQLGGAVSKISHDLRNILTSAQLFTDRIESSEDPTVRRLAPKLVGSIARAVNLCESTLAFGRVDEPSPRLTRVNLAEIVDDVFAGERLAVGDHQLEFIEDVPTGMMITADGEQLYRVIGNLIRNARQAVVATGKPGEISVTATEDDDQCRVILQDNGPGLPQKAREHLFEAFQGGTTRGGSGLGLAIAAELVRGHGGRLELEHTDETGTRFAITLPKSYLTLSPTFA